MKECFIPNPFTIRVIAPDDPFCDRTTELAELSAHAANKTNSDSDLP